MNFKDFYKGKSPRYSFEIFPPKTADGVSSLFTCLKDLTQFDPAFVSVTYGAMGSTRNLTSDLAIRIHQELQLNAAFHFTCVGSGRDSIKNYVEPLKKSGINLVVALRGDPPQGIKNFTPPPDGFAYANELVDYLKNINGFSLAVAGYPEGHVEAPNREVDMQNLKRKVDAGADIVITQLFFDNKDYFDFVDRARKIEISLPIIPGIMPIQSITQVEKIAGMCGAKIPEALHAKLKASKDDPDKMKNIGVEHALNQCRDLIAHKVPGIHFYTLNKSESVGKILKAL